MRAELQRKAVQHRAIEQRLEALDQRENSLATNSSGKSKTQELEARIAKLEAEIDEVKTQEIVAKQALSDAARRVADYTSKYPVTR